MNRAEFNKKSREFYKNREKAIEETFNVDIYDAKELGFIEGVHFGLRDVGWPCLSFTIHAKGGASLQVLFSPEYEYFIYEYGVSDIKDLDGKPIWLFKSGSTMKYIEPYK